MSGYDPKFHGDGTVTVWIPVERRWRRVPVFDIPDPAFPSNTNDAIWHLLISGVAAEALRQHNQRLEAAGVPKGGRSCGA